MKLLFIAHSLLVDCGKASKQTKGQTSGVFSEAGTAPFTKYTS
jgi:hypothetical protein